jgi:hypothetical protein
LYPLPSGLQVLAMDSRIQLQNKKNCLLGLQAKEWPGKPDR